MGAGVSTIPEELDRLEALEKATSPGLWREKASYVMDPTGEQAVALCFTGTADAILITESRNALPALLAEVRLLREALASRGHSRGCDLGMADLLPCRCVMVLLSPTRKLGEKP